MSRDRLSKKLRNRMRSALAGVPAGQPSPLVPNDLLRAHESLFGFLTAFAPGKRVLIQGALSGFPAAMAQERGADSVTAVLPTGRAVRYAQRAWPAAAQTFTTSASGAFDLVIARGDAAGLGRVLEPAAETVLLHLSPRVAFTPEWRRDEDSLRARFATVRRFVHRAVSTLDLASPDVSTLTPADFRFDELLAGEELPRESLTVLYLATNEPPWSPPDFRLHLGCGPVALPGWINIDNRPYPGVDLVWDLALGIPFRNARYAFAEHFIEHLSLDQGASFLEGCRAALGERGILRLSTPNLDWVWSATYHPREWSGDREAVRDCLALNRSFRGWGHQFLYNRTMLTAALRRAGFAAVSERTYGESDDPELRGIEHHERYPDLPDVRHVLVLEASGRAEPEAPYEELEAEFRRDLNVV
ncbi:MAG: hypothetical protein F9K18_05450 [Thermoanaerobaculia bacterium]|nr:MAG: hypothetical protein F9K18_05450 [Thermoanaerobaculia bacterium]